MPGCTNNQRYNSLDSFVYLRKNSLVVYIYTLDYTYSYFLKDPFEAIPLKALKGHAPITHY